MTTWRQQLLALAHGQIGRGISRAQRHRLDLHRPFGEPSEWMDDLTGFTQYCVERSLSPVFCSVHREQRDALLEAGWSSIEVGSEMVVDPRGWKTTGKKWQDVRTAINKAKRDGVTDAVHVPGSVARCARADRGHLRGVGAARWALPEMKFTLGGVEELRDPRVRLLYAIDADGARLGVTSWLPTWRDGRIVGWTLDFMRHRTRQSQRHYGVPDRAHGRAPARRGALRILSMPWSS